MDSVTQLVLGAAVGEAVMGRRVGNRAVLWGAIAGTLPDLDVFVDKGDVVRNMVLHRAETHAYVWQALASPFLAAVQVIVYAGAIMVLFLFVIMLLNLRTDIDDGVHHAARRLFGWLLGIALAALIFLFLQRPWALGPAGTETPERVAEVIVK